MTKSRWSWNNFKKITSDVVQSSTTKITQLVHNAREHSPQALQTVTDTIKATPEKIKTFAQTTMDKYPEAKEYVSDLKKTLPPKIKKVTDDIAQSRAAHWITSINYGSTMANTVFLAGGIVTACVPAGAALNVLTATKYAAAGGTLAISTALASNKIATNTDLKTLYRDQIKDLQKRNAELEINCILLSKKVAKIEKEQTEAILRIYTVVDRMISEFSDEKQISDFRKLMALPSDTPSYQIPLSFDEQEVFSPHASQELPSSEPTPRNLNQLEDPFEVDLPSPKNAGFFKPNKPLSVSIPHSTQMDSPAQELSINEFLDVPLSPTVPTFPNENYFADKDAPIVVCSP